jgi:hypothetical protein
MIWIGLCQPFSGERSRGERPDDDPWTTVCGLGNAAVRTRKPRKRAPSHGHWEIQEVPLETASETARVLSSRPNAQCVDDDCQNRPNGEAAVSSTTR